jgi:hypothetical protein
VFLVIKTNSDTRTHSSINVLSFRCSLCERGQREASERTDSTACRRSYAAVALRTLDDSSHSAPAANRSIRRRFRLLAALPLKNAYPFTKWPPRFGHSTSLCVYIICALLPLCKRGEVSVNQPSKPDSSVFAQFFFLLGALS